MTHRKRSTKQPDALVSEIKYRPPAIPGGAIVPEAPDVAGEPHQPKSARIREQVYARPAGAILKTGQLQSAIFNSANFSSIATDAKGVIQIFNVGAERMLGYTAAEVVNKITPADISDPQEVIVRAEALSVELGTPIAPGFEALVFKASRGIEDIYELTYIRKDRSRFPAVVSVTALRDAQDAIIGYLLIGTDNTARKHAEEALLKAGALQNAIFNSATFSSIATDVNGVIQIFNVGAERMLGYTAAEVVNKITPADLYDPEEAIARAHALSIELGIPIAPGFEVVSAKASRGIEDIYELTKIRKDGSRFPAVVSVTALRDPQDAIIGYLLIATDNTARKRLEEVLEQIRQDQMRFKDEFLSHVSHELRSPLTAIKQFTNILLGGLAGELNKEQREYQQIVLRNIRQLQSMIDDLLEVTRLETGKLTVEPERLSVLMAVTDSFNTLEGSARGKRITLSYDLPPNLPSAHADQTRVRQILIILLDNAIKFTPEGGSVTIRAGVYEKDSRFVLVEVSDTGVGISTEITEEIFERLYQVSERTEASRKGLGLGLYICKELVMRQGGRIWATRRRPKGSTFSFTLPVFSYDASIALSDNSGNRPAETALAEAS
ncbi:MAG TPA: PAS domain S-box protein [Gemmatimonadaceae bacterium]|nr:PAS domain S-box protein [Gemmatimonadaceae bacterium]